MAIIRHLIFAAAMAVCGAASAGERPLVVVELFTSQGCSSCPPADDFVAELAKEPSALVVSYPVDYWDYLGWKDTLADRSFTARQRAYGDSRGDRHIYTPQVVVNGAKHAVGSDRDAVNRSRMSGRGKGAMSVAVSAEIDGETIRIKVEGTPPANRQPATVYLVALVKRAEVAITRGENKGRSVTYTNVVRELVPLGAWDGTKSAYDAPASIAKMRSADAFAVIVQEGTPERPGLIYGAAKGPGL
jgi:hypothetical protein